MRGRIVRPSGSCVGERALVAAMLQQALDDAQRGSADAQDWLAGVGAEWAEAFLEVPAEKVRRWRELCASQKHVKRRG